MAHTVSLVCHQRTHFSLSSGTVATAELQPATIHARMPEHAGVRAAARSLCVGLVVEAPVDARPLRSQPGIKLPDEIPARS